MGEVVDVILLKTVGRRMYKAQYFVFGVAMLSSTAYAEDDGIGSDTVKLVPSVSIGGEYRSNLYLDEGEAGGGSPVVQGTALLVNPTVGLKVNSSILSLRLGSGYGVRKYIQDDLQNLNSFNDGRLTATGRLLPKAPVGISFSESFSSNNRPVNQPKAESALIRVYDNKSRVGLSVGNGTALDVNVGGSYNYRQINGMRDSQGIRDVINQRNTYGGVGTVSWKFLPKTKVLLDGEYTQNDWINNTIETTEETTIIEDSSAWNVKTGIEGQLSGKTLLRFMVGSGGSAYGEGDSATQLDGLSQRLRLDAGLRVKPSESHDIRLEYKRAFQDVYFTNYNLFHQIGLTYEVNVQDRAIVSVNGQYRNDNYDGPVDRTDQRIQAGGAFALNFADHGAFETALNWRRLASADGIAAIEYDDLGLTFGLKWGY
jgi:hypothetical protein